MSVTDCDAVRPLLPRIAEGEASPAEAICVARHLPDCTGCRILLARERRLGSMLNEELEDSLQVGEEFLRSVMDNLPADPPAPPRKKKHRRHLKLAAFAGLLAGLPALLMRGAEAGASKVPTLSFPRIEGASLESGLGVLLDLGRVLVSAAGTLGHFLPAVHASSDLLSVLIVSAVLAVGAGGLGIATVVALATHRIFKLI